MILGHTIAASVVRMALGDVGIGACRRALDSKDIARGCIVGTGHYVHVDNRAAFLACVPGWCESDPPTGNDQHPVRVM